MRREANRLRGRGVCGPAGRGVHGAQTRRAGDARCGGALARIRVWGLGAARLLYELILRGFAWFCVVENTPSLWHFVPEWSSFSVNGFVVLFMNNYEYKPDVLKQLNGEYNMNNMHISGQKRYSNGADTRDKRKERRTLHD